MKEFSADDAYYITHKLLGNIEPIGESNYDKKCLENLKQYVELIYMLMDDIQLLFPCKDSYEGSVKDIGNYASECCSSLAKNISRWIIEYQGVVNDNYNTQ